MRTLSCGNLACGQPDPIGYPSDTLPEDNQPPFAVVGDHLGSVSDGILGIDDDSSGTMAGSSRTTRCWPKP